MSGHLPGCLLFQRGRRVTSTSVWPPTWLFIVPAWAESYLNECLATYLAVYCSSVGGELPQRVSGHLPSCLLFQRGRRVTSMSVWPPTWLFIVAASAESYLNECLATYLAVYCSSVSGELPQRVSGHLPSCLLFQRQRRVTSTSVWPPT